MYIENKLGAFLILLVIALLFWIFLSLSERDIIKEGSRIESTITAVLGLFAIIGFFLALYLVLSIATGLWINYKVGKWFP
jgi:uncharacterized membrane protein